MHPALYPRKKTRGNVWPSIGCWRHSYVWPEKRSEWATVTLIGSSTCPASMLITQPWRTFIKHTGNSNSCTQQALFIYLSLKRMIFSYKNKSLIAFKENLFPKTKSVNFYPYFVNTSKDPMLHAVCRGVNLSRSSTSFTLAPFFTITSNSATFPDLTASCMFPHWSLWGDDIAGAGGKYNVMFFLFNDKCCNSQHGRNDWTNVVNRRKRQFHQFINDKSTQSICWYALSIQHQYPYHLW